MAERIVVTFVALFLPKKSYSTMTVTFKKLIFPKSCKIRFFGSLKFLNNCNVLKSTYTTYILVS